MLPTFEEHEESQDIPVGYGIEHGSDGSFYPYRVDEADATVIYHLCDDRTFDICCVSRAEAVQAIVTDASGRNRQYAPDGSNYHDHLCRCPGCEPHPPDGYQKRSKMA